MKRAFRIDLGGSGSSVKEAAVGAECTMNSLLNLDRHSQEIQLLQPDLDRQYMCDIPSLIFEVGIEHRFFSKRCPAYTISRSSLYFQSSEILALHPTGKAETLLRISFIVLILEWQVRADRQLIVA